MINVTMLTLGVPEPNYSLTGRARANKIVPDQSAPSGLFVVFSANYLLITRTDLSRLSIE